MAEGGEVSAHTPERAKQGERTVRLDEMTGVQTLQRTPPDVPILPGHVLRREFASLRHATQSWFLHFDVATGKVIEPSWGPTRCEDDGVAQLHRLIACSPETKRWHLIRNNLDIHRSEPLVCWIADREGIEQDMLGVKGKRGLLHSMKSRAAFLYDPAHRVGFSSTPKTCLLTCPARSSKTNAMRKGWSSRPAR